MAQGNGATHGVDLGRVQPQGVDDRQRLGGKGLVQLKPVDGVLLQAGMAQRGRNRLDGADAHDVRRHAARGVADKAGEWFEPEALDRTLAGQNQGTCAVRGLRAVARRDRAARREHRAQLGQALDGGVGARALVQAHQAAGFQHLAGGQVGGAVHHLHRGDLVLELAGRHGCQRALVRGQGKLVLRLPAHLPLGGHFLGGQAHAVGDANVVIIAKHGC